MDIETQILSELQCGTSPGDILRAAASALDFQDDTKRDDSLIALIKTDARKNGTAAGALSALVDALFELSDETDNPRFAAEAEVLSLHLQDFEREVTERMPE